MTIRRDIVPDSLQLGRGRRAYTPGVLIGTTLYIAGQVGQNDRLEVMTDVAAQMQQAFDNLKSVLDAVEATFDDIVEMTTYHVDMQDKEIFKRLKSRYFSDRVPAWTAVQVSCLAAPQWVLAIKCVAVIGAR